jgi:hypothetical protein
MNGLGKYQNGGSTLEPTFTAFSGALPRYFGRDAGTVEVTASGDFLPGSTHPSMLFAFAIGDLEGNDEVVIGTQPGTIVKFADDTQGGQYFVGGKGYLEVGPGVGMYEALGDYDRPVLWNLEAKVCFMGRSSISPFKSSLSFRGDLVLDATPPTTAEPPDWGPQDAVFRSDADIEDGDVSGDEDNANVRIYGTLTVRDPFVTIDNNRSLSSWWGGSSVFSNTFAETNSMTASMSGLDWGMFRDGNATEYPSNLPKHSTVAHMGRSFESKGLVPGALWTDMTAGTAEEKVDALVAATALQSIAEPGRGSQWQRWFRPRETVVNFSMEEYVPNLNTEETQFLKLKVGGPMQSNPSSVYPNWAYPGVGAEQRFQSASYCANPAPVVPSPPTFLALGVERADYLPSGDTYGDDRESDTLCRRISPGGGGAADYVCRYPHTLKPADAGWTSGQRLGIVASIATSTAANEKSAWYYTNPEAAGNEGGEWNCAWRRLADDRRDRMRIHHSTAFAFGGRPGTNDYRPV